MTYLKLRYKSKSSTVSTEQRFSDEVSNWVEFDKEVLEWRLEVDKKYQESTFSRCRMVTCEKDICTASDVNIHETLTPLDHSILFLDGHALENIVGQPDFIIVNDNMILLVEKESHEGSFVCSNETWFFKGEVEKIEEEYYRWFKSKDGANG
ncbi:3158_t:CDS:2 [Funneliformis mosseae]|uniref:3158_t:CDS:1 n=1 Tax=Funneliformis mosseae TaxID=27381 RepID=A0A9N8VPX2_FUNMO|nr:3158_t:CDS:2 [Funneliformis mosseae]